MTWNQKRFLPLILETVFDSWSKCRQALSKRLPWTAFSLEPIEKYVLSHKFSMWKRTFQFAKPQKVYCIVGFSIQVSETFVNLKSSQRIRGFAFGAQEYKMINQVPQDWIFTWMPARPFPEFQNTDLQDDKGLLQYFYSRKIQKLFFCNHWLAISSPSQSTAVCV